MLWPKPTVEAGRGTHMAPRPSAGRSAKKKGSTLRRDGYAGCCPSALARRKGGLWSPADQRKRGPHRPSALFFCSCALLLRPSPGLRPRRRGSSTQQQPSARARRVGCRIDSSSDPFPFPPGLPSVLSQAPPQGTWQADKTGGRGAGSSRIWPAGPAVYPPFQGGVSGSPGRAPRGTLLLARARCGRILTEGLHYASGT